MCAAFIIRVLRPEGVEEAVGEAAVAVGEDAELPWPLLPPASRGVKLWTATRIDAAALLGAPVQKRRERPVERLVDLFEAPPPLPLGQARGCPGMSVPSLTSAKQSGAANGRLQSTTRRL